MPTFAPRHPVSSQLSRDLTDAWVRLKHARAVGDISEEIVMSRRIDVLLDRVNRRKEDQSA